MENYAETQPNSKKTRKLPKAIPFVLINILIERYSTVGTSGEFIE
jgi:hypothetical protein